MPKDEESSKEVIEHRLINEEYKIWKKNTPFMYDMIITHALQWPSLTVEWLPSREEPSGEGYVLQKMILGTQANTYDQLDYLLVAQVQLPSADTELDVRLYEDFDAGGIGAANRRVEVIHRIVHDGEVNRARYMPQNEFIVATKSVNAQVNIFDYSKRPSVQSLNGACNPDLMLKGHHLEGFGLSWSKLNPGYLLSGSDDAQICMWDINETPANKMLFPIDIIKAHDGCVEDVAWHSTQKNIFGSVGDDKYLRLWDLRCQSARAPVKATAAHNAEVFCLAFNPFNENVVATGSADTTVKLFDLRKFGSTLHTLDCHKDEIHQVGWNPSNEAVLASSCIGRRVMVWDLGRIGEAQTPKEAADGPPEQVFIHGGHTSKITDFSWNPTEQWVIASVAEDNVLQIWQMSENIYLDEEDLVGKANAKP